MEVYPPKSKTGRIRNGGCENGPCAHFRFSSGEGPYILVPVSSIRWLPLVGLAVAASISPAAIVERWTRSQVFGTDPYFIEAVAVDGANNVFAAGRSQADGNWDVQVVKFNATGKLQWTKRYAVPGDQNATGVAVDANGNVYVDTRSEVAGEGLTLRKLRSSDGGTVWAHKAADPEHTYRSHGISLDQAGRLYWTISLEGIDLEREFTTRIFAGGPAALHKVTVPISPNDEVFDTAIRPEGGLYVLFGYSVQHLYGGTIRNVPGDVALLGVDGTLKGPRPVGFGRTISYYQGSLTVIGDDWASFDPRVRFTKYPDFAGQPLLQAQPGWRQPWHSVSTSAGTFFACLADGGVHFRSTQTQTALSFTAFPSAAPPLLRATDSGLMVLMVGGSGVHQVRSNMTSVGSSLLNGVSTVHLNSGGSLGMANGSQGSLRLCEVTP